MFPYPIPKPGKNPFSIKGYRDVYNSKLLLKIIDKIITNRILKLLYENDYKFINNAYLRYNNQHNCIINYLSYVLNQYKAYYPKFYIYTIQIDIVKAFMSMKMKFVRIILQKYNIPIEIIQFVINFLDSFYYFLTFHDEFTDIRHKKGFTPGSAIVGLLFILYFDFVLCETNLEQIPFPFSDDSLMVGKISRQFDAQVIALNLQTKLKFMKTQFIKYNFNINISKTQIMIFNCKNGIFNQYVPKECQIFVNKLKFLGVWIDSDWSFRTLYDKVTYKLTINLNLLKQYRRSVYKMHGIDLKSLIYAFVVSHMRYGLIIGYPHWTRDQIKNLHQYINNSLKIIFSGNLHILQYIHDIEHLDYIFYFEVFKFVSLNIRLSDLYPNDYIMPYINDFIEFSNNDIDIKELRKLPWKGWLKFYEILKKYHFPEYPFIEENPTEYHLTYFQQIIQGNPFFLQETMKWNINDEKDIPINTLYGFSDGSCIPVNDTKYNYETLNNYVYDTSNCIYGKGIGITSAGYIIKNSKHILNLNDCGEGLINNGNIVHAEAHALKKLSSLHKKYYDNDHNYINHQFISDSEQILN